MQKYLRLWLMLPILDVVGLSVVFSDGSCDDEVWLVELVGIELESIIVEEDRFDLWEELMP